MIRLATLIYRLARLLTAEGRYWEMAARVEAHLATIDHNPEGNPNA